MPKCKDCNDTEMTSVDFYLWKGECIFCRKKRLDEVARRMDKLERKDDKEKIK